MVKNIIIVFLLLTTALSGFLWFRAYNNDSDMQSLVDTVRYERMVAEQELLEAQKELKKNEIKLVSVQGELDTIKINLQKEQMLVQGLQDQISTLEQENADLENALKALTMVTESSTTE